MAHTARSSTRELALLAQTLITTWSIRTGRALRPGPVSELTVAELEEFWEDDRLEPPYATRRAVPAGPRVPSRPIDQEDRP